MWTTSRGCETERSPTRRDSLIAAGLTLGVALAIAALMLLVDHPAAETIGLTMTPGALVIGTQWLYLRDRSWPVKLVLVGGPLIVLFLIGLVAAGIRS